VTAHASPLGRDVVASTLVGVRYSGRLTAPHIATSTAGCHDANGLHYVLHLLKPRSVMSNMDPPSQKMYIPCLTSSTGACVLSHRLSVFSAIDVSSATLCADSTLIVTLSHLQLLTPGSMHQQPLYNADCPPIRSTCKAGVRQSVSHRRQQAHRQVRLLIVHCQSLDTCEILLHPGG
jgi:hypothetical protein